ncbi:hypothetical protein [Poriferisphaera corsica]|nr:hypothetical protein [Poriferisphaera corsica]
MAALPGWLFVFAAMSLLGMTLLTPQWLSCRELMWQAKVMQAQTGRLEMMQGRYEAYLQALEMGDLTVYEQLAYTELSLKPTGKDIFFVAQELYDQERLDDSQMMSAIERQLDVSLDVIGHEVAPYEPVNSRLVRMTTKPKSRYLLMGMGLICLFLGVWPQGVKPEED